MREAGQDDVLELVELRLDALVNVGIGVAEDVDPPGADDVEVATAVEVIEPRPLAALDGHKRDRLMILHLRAGMPKDVQVATLPILVKGHTGLLAFENGFFDPAAEVPPAA